MQKLDMVEAGASSGQEVLAGGGDTSSKHNIIILEFFIWKCNRLWRFNCCKKKRNSSW